MDIIISETKKIAITLVITDILITIITLVAKWFDLSIVFGMLYGFVFAILNFALLGTVVEKALSMDEKSAKHHMKVHYAIRFILLAIILTIPFLTEKINALCVVIAMLSPKLTYFAIGYASLIPMILPKRSSRHSKKKKNNCNTDEL